MAFTVYIEHDGTETTLGTLTGTTRSVATFPVNKAVKEFSIRIASTTEEEWLTVHEITVDVESSQEEGV
jgi:hypothetical protein